MPRIDHCNSLLYGVAATNLSSRCKTRQSDWWAHCQVMNTSHRGLYIFTGCRLSVESISRLLCSVSTAFMDTPPVTLKSMVAIKKTSTYNLSSSSSIQLEDHSRRSKKRLAGNRAFSNASAKIWNSLPQSLQSQQNFNTFKSLLKTHYFRKAFNL